MRLRPALLVLAVVAGVMPAAPAPAAPVPCRACVADFAIYDPVREEDGVWEEDVTALETILDAYGFTHRRVDAPGIAGGALGSGAGRRFRALLEPGGWAYTRNVALGATGAARLRSFVQSGGGYVGFCAGAYAAAALVRFDLQGAGYYQSIPYSLQLFPGAAAGPFGWMPWRDGTNANLVEAAIEVGNPTMRAIGIPARTRFLYGGGPWFEPYLSPARYEVWARAVAPPGATNRAGDGKPTIVKLAYGRGTVVLFAYHPEILIGSTADGVVLRQFCDEGAIDWDLGDLTLEQIDLDSWNVVHAALQVAIGQRAAPVLALPQASLPAP
ncbi:MAG TPA: BPL-N domain-containing protein [Thermoanaerobaculia bacterium]|jgi:glutamine amidotransferase-like uncharacterized protein|nr:BPL-N domain-containing protein [Thermoanaerobaculia bacterium]